MDVDHHHLVLEKEIFELVGTEPLGRELDGCDPLSTRTGIAAAPIA